MSTGAKQTAVTKNVVILKDGHQHLSRAAFAAHGSLLLSPTPHTHAPLGRSIVQDSWLEGASPHLRLQEFPAVGLELLQLQELEGHILDRELQEVPETRQVLEGGHGERSGVLQRKETEKRQTVREV